MGPAYKILSIIKFNFAELSMVQFIKIFYRNVYLYLLRRPQQRLYSLNVLRKYSQTWYEADHVYIGARSFALFHYTGFQQ